MGAPDKAATGRVRPATTMATLAGPAAKGPARPETRGNKWAPLARLAGVCAPTSPQLQANKINPPGQFSSVWFGLRSGFRPSEWAARLSAIGRRWWRRASKSRFTHSASHKSGHWLARPQLAASLRHTTNGSPVRDKSLMNFPSPAPLANWQTGQLTKHCAKQNKTNRTKPGVAHKARPQAPAAGPADQASAEDHEVPTIAQGHFALH